AETAGAGSNTGLDHTWYRQYSSYLGRWMTPDPAGMAAVDPGNPQTWNRYAYVNNNPTNFIDPLGLRDCLPSDSICVTEPMPPGPDPILDLIGYNGCSIFSMFCGSSFPRQSGQPTRGNPAGNASTGIIPHKFTMSPSQPRPTCLQVFTNAILNPPVDSEQLDRFKALVQGAFQAVAGVSRTAADVNFNAALARGSTLAAAAAAAGRVTVPFRSTVFKGLLTRAQSLLDFAEEAGSEAAAGDAGFAVLDIQLFTALKVELESWESGGCITEKEAIKAILGIN
ncbi:MAG TPA: RHS repeat-associated core domain-containing protein, partial [Terriglobales bacterium]|nr:RHS repeat-associated core domain-containing protein [Terriglobales bacterium]